MAEVWTSWYGIPDPNLLNVQGRFVSEYRFRLGRVCFSILKIQGIYPFYCE